MELNKLPNGHEGSQQRRTEFESEAEKLAYDADNLITLAQKISREKGIAVSPESLITRQDDDVDALRKAIAISLKTKPTSATGATAVETSVEAPRLRAYKEQYDRWGEGVKSRCSWEELTSRLLANNSHYLHLAEAMNENGVLFGVDFEGNPLFADGGEEPIMTNMNYGDTRQAVYFKQEGKKKVATGYEMFPYAGEYEKSPEIEMFEAFSGKPFVKSPNGKEWRSSWLESGENPSLPRNAIFHPGDGSVGVDGADPRNRHPSRGVRRLLRVKKS